MELKSHEINDTTLLMRIIGRFNIEEVQLFEKEFGTYSRGKKTILLDLSEMKYIDSSGIGSFIKAMNMAKNSNCEFVLLNVTAEAYDIFKLAHLDKFFSIMTKRQFIEGHPGIKL